MIRIPFSGPDICDLYAKIIVTLQKGCLGREISFENLVVMDELPDLDWKTSEILKIFDGMLLYCSDVWVGTDSFPRLGFLLDDSRLSEG